MQIDEFTRHYLIAAIWAGIGSGDQYTVEDFAPEAIAEAVKDCGYFREEAGVLYRIACYGYDLTGASSHPDAGSADACAGHDFFLSRSTLGTGFCDRELGIFGQKLAEIAQGYGENYVHVGEDGKIYFD